MVIFCLAVLKRAVLKLTAYNGIKKVGIFPIQTNFCSTQVQTFKLKEIA
jgi:hypothetical protein